MNRRCGKKMLALLAGMLALGVPVPGECVSLSLQDAIELALTRNTELRITQKGEDSADAAYRRAKGQNGLSASVSSSVTTSKQEGSEHSAAWNNGLNASLPLYSGGKNQANIESGELGVKVAELRTARNRENLKYNVIEAYYDALASEQVVAVKREAVENYQAHYDNVSQLFSAGSKARVDVLRSSVELSNAQYELISAQTAHAAMLATLRNYLNIDRKEPLTLTTGYSYDGFSMPLENCVDYAFQHRKDILVDVYTVEQKELAVKVAKAGYLPSVNLNAGPSLNFELRPGSSRTPGISAGVSASWNIFDSGVTKAQVDSAKTDLEVAQLTLDRDRENVDLALRQAYFTMRAAEDQLRSTRDAVGQAEEDYYIAREKYRAGEGIMLDVLDAQKALSEARLQHIQAQYDYVTGKAAVENAMGISLTDREQAAAEQLSLKVALPSDVAPNTQLLKQSFEEEKRQRAKAKEQFSEQVEKDLERVTQETSSHPAVRTGEKEGTVRSQEAALAADEAAGQRKEIAE